MNDEQIKKAFIRGLKQKSFDEYMLNKNIELIMDKTNSDYGSKNEYCIYCKSKQYNSQIGIIHNPDCYILQLRRKIKEFEEK